MAGLTALLGALWRLAWRELETLNTLGSNNFFLVSILLLLQAGPFIKVLLGILVLLPLSADPLSKVPAERFLLWPLSRRERILLRIASLFLSPATWVAVGLVIYTTPGLTVAFVGLITAVQVLRAWSEHRPNVSPLRVLPATSLIGKNLRQLLLHLDTWLAALLAVVTLAFARNTEARLPMTVLVVLALSTPAQCLFSLDLPGGFTRYRLWPLSGVRILLAKDAAFLIVSTLLTVGLAPLPGLAGALAALTFGHHASVMRPMPQQPWRFTSGISVTIGVLQSVALAASTVATDQVGPVFLMLVIAAWAGSLGYYSMKLQHDSAAHD